MKGLITLLFVLGFTGAYAQCNDCKPLKLYQPDYCYTSSDFQGFCAQFDEKSKSFFLQSGKKTIEIPLSEKADGKYFLGLAQDKKLKLTSVEILFTQLAVAKWMEEKNKIGYTFTESGLGIKVVKDGSGELPQTGQNVKVHYSGFLEDGTKFDSSVDRGEPFSFPLGTGRVIKGWDEGVGKLKIGSKAWLRIPADLGYGPRGAGGGVIPPNATLYFEIEVIGVN
jgi:FKBP-type peptidyl-prolyl cis-trans isomerase